MRLPRYVEPVERLPGRPGFEYELRIGHHSRAECVTRPLTWCRAIGGHEGVCVACPLREHRCTF